MAVSRVRWVLAGLVAAALLPLAAAPATAAAPPKPVAPDSKQTLNQPYFRWERVPGATQYQLEVATDSRFLKVLRTQNVDMNRFIDTTTWPAGTYWWRVRVTQPFETDFSKASQFTRRWLVPDADGSGIEVARPDNVTVEDVSADPGLQVSRNRFVLSWEPVADASMYRVQFHTQGGDSTPLVECLTPHTVLTPTFTDRSDEPGDQLPGGGPIERLPGDNPCKLPAEFDTNPLVYIRVRAHDDTADGRVIESLWNDEARDDNDPEPVRLAVEVRDPLTGSTTVGPAALTSPEPGARYADTPVLAWDPVLAAEQYRLVVARDRDFTTRIVDVSTNNTRWVPAGRFPEDDVDQTYFWFVLPCEEDACLSSSAAVNRPGRYRTFSKHSLTLNTRDAVLKPEPWLQFSWQPFSKAVTVTNRQVGRPGDPVGGIKYYEVQWRTMGGPWQGTFTDLPDWLPDTLPFSTRFQWRVRIIDESGQSRPWSDVRTDRTPGAAPDRPSALSAVRTSPTRVRLLWREPDAKFFPVAGYSIFYSTNKKRWKQVDEVNRTQARFRINGKTRYWFMVTAHSRGGESAPSRVYVPRR